MSESKEVLCVISQEQYREYQQELATITNGSVSVESSPALALAMIDQLDPVVIIVGMDLGEMEGIEFIAKMMKRHPHLETPVVVLPDKGDGMPPMVHSRGRATGRSTVDGVDFAQINVLIEEAAEAAARAAEEAAKAVPEIGAALEKGVVPSADTGPAARAEPATPAAAPARSSKTLVIVAVVAVVVLLGGGALWLFGFSGEDARSEPGTGGAGTTAPEVAEPPPPEPTEPAPSEQAATRPPEPSAKEPEEIILPLAFASGDDKPRIKDEAELDRIVEMLRVGDSKIEIAGHTSADGETVDNLQLGMQRAERAMKLLVKRGVSADRFEITSRGERAPAADNETAEGKKLNRRVSIRVQE